MRKTREIILKEARFSPQAISYGILQGVLLSCLTVFGIPLLLFIIPALAWYYPRYYARLQVFLTTRELKVNRGIWMREEKSIPLEKITDLKVYQGPIMRRMGLMGLSVETAGQTSAGGALISIVGLENTGDFRDAVLGQRDHITDREESSPMKPAEHSHHDDRLVKTLEEIRDVLVRVEEKLNR